MNQCITNISQLQRSNQEICGVLQLLPVLPRYLDGPLNGVFTATYNIVHNSSALQRTQFISIGSIFSNQLLKILGCRSISAVPSGQISNIRHDLLGQTEVSSFKGFRLITGIFLQSNFGNSLHIVSKLSFELSTSQFCDKQ